MKKFTFALMITLCLLLTQSYAQTVALDLKADKEAMVEHYMSPFIKGFGANLNAGWANSAKTHKLGGFDITATFNVAIVPKADREYDLSKLTLKGKYDAAENMTPTVGGSVTNKGTMLEYFQDGQSVMKVRAFSGVVPFVPTPTAKVAVGLPWNTEIMGRFIPNVPLGDAGELGLWGVGVKHDFKEDLPFIKRIPILHASVLAAYTNFHSNASFGVEIPEPNLPINLGLSEEDKKLEEAIGVKTQAFNLMALASANLPVVTIFGGVGFSASKSNVTLKGKFPVFTPSTTSIGKVDATTVDQDVDFDVNHVNPVINAGVRFKFAIITLHFDYTYASYSVASAGFGISFR